MDPNILIYLESLPSPEKEIVKTLREAILTADGSITEKLNWPRGGHEQSLTFSFRTPLASVQLKKEKVILIFYYGAAFKDPDKILKGSKDKLRSVEISQMSEVNPLAISDLAKQAVSYNRTYFL